MVERAKSHEHTDGMDLWRCNDSQQWENVLITEHPVRERGGGGRIQDAWKNVYVRVQVSACHTFQQ